ncbi:MAG: hypothetical protein ISQ09_08390 [Rubripirellula sp.]|nr:hypothetical protein [Rubripirellula sp.]
MKKHHDSVVQSMPLRLLIIPHNDRQSLRTPQLLCTQQLLCRNFPAETFIAAPLMHIIALMRDVSTNYPEAVFSKKPLVGTLNLGLVTHKYFFVYW